jgi:hypothetical protein
VKLFLTTRSTHTHNNNADELLEQEEGGDDEDLELTESERDKYKQENTQLQHNFETLIDKTREIEKQVIEISHLQTLFADKVSQQKVQRTVLCVCVRVVYVSVRALPVSV